MIRRYLIDDSSLISRINLDFFGRIISDKDMEDKIEEIRASLEKNPFQQYPPIIFGTQRDDTLSTRFDLIEKLSSIPSRYRNGEHDTTMRFRRNAETGEVLVRIPPAHRRIPLYENNTMMPENQAGYLIQKKEFVVCAFADADIVLGESGCKQRTINFRKQRFQGIYGKINSDELISIYLIDQFVDERYYFKYLYSRKSA